MTAETDQHGAPDDGRLLTPEFGRLAVTSMAFFLAMGATFPVLPRFVKDDLGGGDAAVGLVVGATAVGAIVARPFIGHIGDRRGRGVLMVGGALVATVAQLGLLVVPNIAALLVLRVVFGAGAGAVIVGATTLAVDLASEQRRGEATSYIFVALHLGSGTGPVVGEWALRQWDFDAVWLLAAGGALLAAALALSIPSSASTDVDLTDAPMQILHRRALLPGAILGIGIVGFTGFNAFVPLFGDEIGVDNIGPVFMLASFTIVVMRSVGARLPDWLGPIRGGTFALTLSAIGLGVIGFVDVAGGLYVGTVIMSIGTSMLLPSLVPAAVDGVPPNERSRALATYTLFLEVSQALGAVAFGAVSGATSYANGFLMGAVCCVVALAVLHGALRPRIAAEEEATGQLPTRPVS